MVKRGRSERSENKFKIVLFHSDIYPIIIVKKHVLYLNILRCSCKMCSNDTMEVRVCCRDVKETADLLKGRNIMCITQYDGFTVRNSLTLEIVYVCRFRDKILFGHNYLRSNVQHMIKCKKHVYKNIMQNHELRDFLRRGVGPDICLSYECLIMVSGIIS